MKDDVITVKMKEPSKPNGTGTIHGNTGTLTLDKKKFNISYDPLTETIFFEPRSAGIKWTKVKKG